MPQGSQFGDKSWDATGLGMLLCFCEEVEKFATKFFWVFGELSELSTCLLDCVWVC